MKGLSVCVSGAALVLVTVALLSAQLSQEASASSSTFRSAASGDLHAVANIRFEGLPRAFGDGALATQIGAPLRENDLTHDRRLIETQLVSRGYLAAKVRSVNTVWRTDGAHVTFSVEPGGLYRVGRVQVSGPLLRKFPQLAEVPTMLTGQAWSQTRATANHTMLRDWIARRQGRAEVSLTTAVDHARLVVDVQFTVRPRRGAVTARDGSWAELR